LTGRVVGGGGGEQAVTPRVRGRLYVMGEHWISYNTQGQKINSENV